VTSDLFFDQALLPGGWAKNVNICIDDGKIKSLAAGSLPAGGVERHALALPGMPNLHSHSFQRAFSGLTETRGSSTDSFWSWRDLMYRFALQMSPDDVEAVATHAFVEMLEAGFTAVAEFHYLHHSPDGSPYADIAELAGRIGAAASAVGIGLTLLPVFYAHANFGGLSPNPGQRRFISSLDQFARLYARCKEISSCLPGGGCGIAPHSLRAVTPDELTALTSLAGDAPLHLHIAEQTGEVEDCIVWSGARPVEFLLDHFPVNEHWCLVHATHANAGELAAMAGAGAVVGLCPITEANLGDGLFHAHTFAGDFGIGSDSNVLISVAQELRQLEYAERLRLRQRNVMASDACPATATHLYQRTVSGGGQALGSAAGLHVGAAANIVTLDTKRLGPGAESPDTALNVAVFSAPVPVIDTVWVRGQKIVAQGRHPLAEASRRRFDEVVSRLL
jgi:formiminoglutamate deiminase